MARLLNEEVVEVKQTGSRQRSPTYLAPEQVEGQTRMIGPQTDVYALGAILYKLLTGDAPFEVATLQGGREQVLTQAPIPPSQRNAEVPRDLESICLKCLTKELGNRYATALELADDLRCFLNAPLARTPEVG